MPKSTKLTTPLPPRVNDSAAFGRVGSPTARSASVSVACIARELNWGHVDYQNTASVCLLESVALAGHLLAQFEAIRGDFWDTAANDWESTCAVIARALAEGLGAQEAVRLGTDFAKGWEDATS